MPDGTSNYWGCKRWTEWSAIDDVNIDSDNDTYEYHFPMPVMVTRVAILATTAVVNAAGTVDIEMYRVTDASDGGADTLLGTCKILGTTTLAVGDVAVCNCVGADTDGEVAEDSTTRYVGPTGPYEITTGQGFLLKVVEPSDSGACKVAIEYIPLPFDENDTDVARVYDVPV